VLDHRHPGDLEGHDLGCNWRDDAVADVERVTRLVVANSFRHSVPCLGYADPHGRPLPIPVTFRNSGTPSANTLRLAELLDRAAEGGTTITSYRVALPPALPAEVEGFLTDRGAHGNEARAAV
jgi:hypothetical protein